MTISRSRFSLPAHLLIVLTLVLGLSGGLATATAPPAEALASGTTRVKALRMAASKIGTYYQWGGAGPRRFDCSGLTQWAYARAGKRLPRVVSQQYAATVRVSRASARPGDLVFFMSGGRPYHMGMYAAGARGRVLHAPKPGHRIKVVRIWAGAVYKRVR